MEIVPNIYFIMQPVIEYMGKGCAEKEIKDGKCNLKSTLSGLYIKLTIRNLQNTIQN